MDDGGGDSYGEEEEEESEEMLDVSYVTNQFDQLIVKLIN
jgi:hypothetical protein